MWVEFRILGPITKLRNSTINFLMSVCPSAWNNLVPTRSIFMKFGIWVFFENLSRKFKFYSNLKKYRVLYMKTDIHFWSHFAQFSLVRKVFQTRVVEKIETGILYSVTFFFSKILSFIKYVEKYGRTGRQATDYNMVHVHCILDT